MALKTKRWDDEVEADDGFRVLVCRYRPRGLKKEFENWDVWWPELGPSTELHAGAYGKGGVKIGWEVYKRRFLVEMKNPKSRGRLEEIRERLAKGEGVTLLCSSACVLESRCHRGILREMLNGEG